MDLEHRHWDIENQGFNEAVNQWQSDHVYTHDPIAIPACRLVTIPPINVLRAFDLRNLKRPRRRDSTMLPIARRLAAERYQGSGEPVVPIPTRPARYPARCDISPTRTWRRHDRTTLAGTPPS